MLFLLALTFCLSKPSFGQVDTLNSNVAIAVLPLVYYTPETSWVFGAGAVSNFKLGENSSETYESQVAVGLAYSLFDQVLSYASWRVFKPENKFLFAGEVGWYRYVYFFYGTGNDVREGNQESYYARFPRVRFDAYKKVQKNTFLGIRFWMDQYNVTGIEANGLLDNGSYEGKFGGRNLGIGPVLLIDSRDNQLYPNSGTYFESSVQRFGKEVGGEFDYWRFLNDFRKVHPIAENQVLVGNVYSEITSGGAPFFALPMLGGNRLMRGLFEGKFRDQNMIFIQGEYRRKILPRWGAVVFSGLGNVFSAADPFQIQNTKLTYGLGGRFQLTKKKKLNLRLDLAHSPGQDIQIYFTFGEAF